MIGVMKMDQKIIRLSTEEELRIFMMPMRQKLIRIMSLEGKAMTAKNLADKLNISASAVQNHIRKLEKIGLIEHDHYEKITGIQANYFKLTGVTVSIGQDSNDGLANDRDVVVRNLISQIYGNYTDTVHALSAKGIKNTGEFGDFLSGVIHLSPKDSSKLLKLISKFVQEHEHIDENTVPWEFEMILYQTGLDGKGGEGS